MKSDKLSALLSLLDEPDDNVYEQIRKQIFSFGPRAIKPLEQASENEFDYHVQIRIQSLLRSIRQDQLSIEFADWIRFGSSDLLKGFLLVSRIGYPDIDESGLTIPVEQMKMDIWLELNDNLTALENVKVLNHVIYDMHRYEGNRTDINALSNQFINTLMETRKGSPLTMGILYIILSRRLNIPVYGVNLPQHFILAYLRENDIPYPVENDILFYINPFNKGAVFTRREIDLFLRQLKIKPDPSFFEPCTHVDIIQRLLNNMVLAYTPLGDQEKLETLEEMLNLINELNQS